jgi:hypothetical protein
VKLENAPELREKLNEATAQLNELIVNYEKLLVDKNMKIIVRLSVESGRVKGTMTWNRGPTKAWCLGWETGNGGDWSMLIHATRHVRIAAVSFFPQMLDAIVAEMAKQLVDTDAAVESADRFLQAFHEAALIKKP